MAKEDSKGNKDTPNRRTYVVTAKIPPGQAKGKRDVVTVTTCTCCGRAHPNTKILAGESGGHYYNCPITEGVVYVRIE